MKKLMLVAVLTASLPVLGCGRNWNSYYATNACGCGGGECDDCCGASQYGGSAVFSPQYLPESSGQYYLPPASTAPVLPGPEIVQP